MKHQNGGTITSSESALNSRLRLTLNLSPRSDLFPSKKQSPQVWTNDGYSPIWDVPSYTEQPITPPGEYRKPSPVPKGDYAYLSPKSPIPPSKNDRYLASPKSPPIRKPSNVKLALCINTDLAKPMPSVPRSAQLTTGVRWLSQTSEPSAKSLPTPNRPLKGILRAVPTKPPKERAASPQSPPKAPKFTDRVQEFVRRRSVSAPATFTPDSRPKEWHADTPVDTRLPPIPLNELDRTELEELVFKLHADVVASQLETQKSKKAELMMQSQLDLLGPKVLLKIQTLELNVAQLEYTYNEKRCEAARLKAELEQVLRLMRCV